MTIPGPVYVTPTALASWRRLRRFTGPDPAAYTAIAAELAPIMARQPDPVVLQTYRDGRRLLRYRGGRPLRLQYLVADPEFAGDLPVLVDVLPGHSGPGR